MSAELNKVFQKCKSLKRNVFIPYLTAGFPHPDMTVGLMLALEKAGADVIELGIPFSDPLADGPTIQESNEIALRYDTSYSDCIEFVKEARERGLKAPVVLMGYYNPLLQFGEEKAVIEAKNAGANGFIVVDLPPSEAQDFLGICRHEEMSLIPLVALTTSDSRLLEVVSLADSFIYCVSVTGVTGQRNSVNAELPKFLNRIREHTDRFLAVGFGISSREQFLEVAQYSDAIVIGSAIIRSVLQSVHSLTSEKDSEENAVLKWKADIRQQLINYVSKLSGTQSS